MGDLVMNPLADVHVHPMPPAPLEVITVRCPVRGQGLVVRELRAGDALFPFFAALVARGGEVELDSDDEIVGALVEIGFLVDEIVEWPAFAIRAADVPPGGDAPRDVLAQDEFALRDGIAWPADYAEQEGRLRCFARGPAVWVGDTPYWGPAPARVTPPPDLAAAARAYAGDEVAIVRGFVAPAELAALQRYYAALLAANLVPFGDRQHRARYSAYNDPIGRFVHVRCAAAFSAVAGQPLVPAFSYFFSYVGGADLPPHKDRAQAEFSISLQLDRTVPWPLDFAFDDGRIVSAILAPGDAVLYHGAAVTHARGPLPRGERSSVLVLEYVTATFAGVLA